MIRSDNALSQFVAYDPETGTTTENVAKLPPVVFLEDTGTTSVLHRVCLECLSAQAQNPSCLLLGEFPHGMEFKAEEIPGWEILPEHLRILGVDRRQKSRKTEQLTYMQLESLRIQETLKQMALQDRTMQAIAQVLQTCEKEKTNEEQHIRVDLQTYEKIHALCDSWIEQNRSIDAALAEIDRQTDDISIDAFERKRGRREKSGFIRDHLQTFNPIL